jgi:uncharacterized protein (UPF0276 family)
MVSDHVAFVRTNEVEAGHLLPVPLTRDCLDVSRTGALLLLDVENLYANWVNFGRNPLLALKELPLEQIGYVHVGGGVLKDGIWHDTHAHAVHPGVWDLLDAVAERVRIPGALLERDASFPPTAELLGELRRIRSTIGA